MTALSTDLRSSLADLQTRHADLITAVSGYKDGSLGRAIADVQAANQAVTARLDAEESAILGLAVLKSAKPQPSLCLDFAEQKYLEGTRRLEKGYGLGGLLTFTRASGGGRFNAQGQYEWLPAGQPRLDYDPVTGEAKGLLIEEQRTNLLTYSSDFANAAWTKTGSTIIANATIAPNGFSTANKLVESAGNSGHNIQPTLAAVSGTMYTFSCFVKKAERTFARIATFNGLSTNGVAVNLDTGAISATNGSPAAFGAQNTGNGWWRIWITSVATASTPTTLGSIGASTGLTFADAAYQGDDTSGIYIWGAQLEQGAFPTSYIPTTTAQVTRAADIASVNKLSPWYNASEGTVAAKASLYPRTSGFPPFFELSPDFQVLRSMSNAVIAGNGRGDPGFSPIYGTTLTPKVAVRYSDTAVRVSVNGVLGTDTALARINPTTVLRVGYKTAGGSGYLNGHIESIQYFPRALTNAELQRLTS